MTKFTEKFLNRLKTSRNTRKNPDGYLIHLKNCLTFLYKLMTFSFLIGAFKLRPAFTMTELEKILYEARAAKENRGIKNIFGPGV